MLEINSEVVSGPAIGMDPFFAGMVGDPLAAVAIIDSQGRMIYTNRQWDRVQTVAYGLGLDTLNGRLIEEVFPPEQAREHRELLRRAASRRQPFVIRKCCAGRMYAVWTYPVFPPTRFSTSQPVFLFVVRPEIVDEDILEVCGDQIAAGVEFQHDDLGPLSVLTNRELEVLALIARGMSTKEMAGMLSRSVKTVESHRTSIGSKLKIDDRVHLAEVARRAGLTTRGVGEIRLEPPSNR